jgi:hypothetical protein
LFLIDTLVEIQPVAAIFSAILNILKPVNTIFQSIQRPEIDGTISTILPAIDFILAPIDAIFNAIPIRALLDDALALEPVEAVIQTFETFGGSSQGNRCGQSGGDGDTR